MTHFKRLDTGAITLLPDKLAHFRDTGQLGLMIVPPHLRDAQNLTVFDPINNTLDFGFSVQGWEQIRPDSYLCRPVGIETFVVDHIDMPPHIWGWLNTKLMGSPVKNCAAVNFCIHNHPWDDMKNITADTTGGAMTRTIYERAHDYIRWELDDVQYQQDRRFCEWMHVMDDATKLGYISGGVKNILVRCPWK